MSNNHRIDHLLEDIDTSMVSALHEIVRSQHEGELLPLFDSFAQEWGLFTLPQIRGLGAGGAPPTHRSSLRRTLTGL